MLGVQLQQLGFQSLINTKDRKFHCLRLRRNFPSRLCGFPLAQHKVGEKTNTPKTTPGTVHPGRGAALPRVTTVPTAMAAPQPCPRSIHRALSPPRPLLSSTLGLVGTPALQSGPGRADLGTGQSRLCCPIAAWANSQLLALAKTLIFFFPFPCTGAVIQSWLQGRGVKKQPLPSKLKRKPWQRWAWKE